MAIVLCSEKKATGFRLQATGYTTGYSPGAPGSSSSAFSFIG